MRRMLPCCLAAALAGCGGDPLFLMFEEHLRTAEGERLVGSGCQSIDGGSGASGAVGGGTGSYSIEHEGHDGEGVRVLVRSGTGELLAVRSYNEDFLESAEVDEFEVEIDPDHTLRLVYWGGDTCEEPREPEE